MAGFLIDHNCEGHAEALRHVLEGPEWLPYWSALKRPIHSLESLGLDEASSDQEIWRRCQAEGLLLLTANRNHDGPRSLEAVIRSEARPDSLPVMTFADADRILASREFAERVAIRLMEHLLDLDNLRGVGRIYLP